LLAQDLAGFGLGLKSDRTGLSGRLRGLSDDLLGNALGLHQLGRPDAGISRDRRGFHDSTEIVERASLVERVASGAEEG
jgi:hypothetical protein